MQSKLIQLGKLLASGLLTVVATFLFMKGVSLNLSYAFMVSAVVLFCVALMQKSNPVGNLIKTLILCSPISLAYYILILPEIPGLWIVIPFFLTMVFAVVDLRSKWIVGVGALMMMLAIAFLIIPRIVTDNLTKVVIEDAPQIELKELTDGELITNQSLAGTIVILDFFGTWCAPCIKEMSVLKEVQEELSSEHYEFIIACTEEAGDTPQKALSFHQKRNLPFRLAFDHGSRVHSKFGFAGVPGLVILDQDGKIRLKHEGYNEAEDLKGELIPFLQKLNNKDQSR